jgi:hypothetical protein
MKSPGLFWSAGAFAVMMDFAIALVKTLQRLFDTLL